MTDRCVPVPRKPNRMYDHNKEAEPTSPADSPTSTLTADHVAALDTFGIDPEVYRRRWWSLAVLCLSLLIIMIGNTSLNVALPSFSAQLGATNAQLQWMVDGYSLVFAGLLFAMGNFGDRYGRKGIMQIGLVVFGVATAYAGFYAETAEQIIGSRVVMGVGAAMVMPATLSIITNIFPPHERAKAVAMWAGISGAGAAIGPLLSGFVLEHGEWNHVFAINIPFIIVALALGAIFVPRSRGEHSAPLDILGGVLSAVGLSALVYAIIEAPHNGWLSVSTMGVGTLGVLALLGFVLWELHTDSPMLDVRLFRIGGFGVSALVLTMVFFALMGSFFSMSQLLQLVWGYSPLEAAVRLLPISVVMMLIAPQSAKLAARFGKSRVVAVGMWCIAAGILTISRTSVEPRYYLLLAGASVMAAGMALAMAPTTDLLMSTVPREQAGMGSAMNDTTRELGGSLGVAVFGSLLASQYVQGLGEMVDAAPAEAREVVTGSLAGALRVAEAAPSNVGPSLHDAALTAWTDGMGFSLTVAGVVVALAGAVAWFFLPDSASDVQGPGDGSAAPVAEEPTTVQA